MCYPVRKACSFASSPHAGFEEFSAERIIGPGRFRSLDFSFGSLQSLTFSVLCMTGPPATECRDQHATFSDLLIAIFQALW